MKDYSKVPIIILTVLEIILLVVFVALFIRQQAHNIQNEIANRNPEPKDEEEMSRR